MQMGLILGYIQKIFKMNISITDIARYKSDEPKDVIKNWMRGKDTLEFLGLWEYLHNPNFKGVEFDAFRTQAGANAFTMSPKKWIESTNAIGIISKSGRYGGTYAHSDIAFEFASWISPEFKLYIIKDYKRLKADENSRLSLNWNLNREFSYTYASEADMLNVVLFGKTAKQWRDANLYEVGNIREQATIYQLLVLANMESYNAILIRQGKSQEERMKLLHELAVQQMTRLKAKAEKGKFMLDE